MRLGALLAASLLGVTHGQHGGNPAVNPPAAPTTSTAPGDANATATTSTRAPTSAPAAPTIRLTTSEGLPLWDAPSEAAGGGSAARVLMHAEAAMNVAFAMPIASVRAASGRVADNALVCGTAWRLRSGGGRTQCCTPEAEIATCEMLGVAPIHCAEAAEMGPDEACVGIETTRAGRSYEITYVGGARGLGKAEPVTVFVEILDTTPPVVSVATWASAHDATSVAVERCGALGADHVASAADANDGACAAPVAGAAAVGGCTLRTSYAVLAWPATAGEGFGAALAAECDARAAKEGLPLPALDMTLESITSALDATLAAAIRAPGAAALLCVGHTATDVAGNSATAYTAALVRDSVAPTIALSMTYVSLECNGARTQSLDEAQVHSTWSVSNGPCVSPIAVTVNDGGVDIGVVGVHDIEYRGGDGWGTFTGISKVEVVDTLPPTFTSCPGPLELHQGRDPYVYAAPIVVDRCVQTPSLHTTEGDGLTRDVAPLKAGSYDVTYVATDPSGNRATCARSVTVVDDHAPTCTLVPVAGAAAAATTAASSVDFVEACTGAFPDAPSSGAGGGVGAQCSDPGTGPSGVDASFPRLAEAVKVTYGGSSESARTITRTRCAPSVVSDVLLIIDTSESLGAGTFHKIKSLVVRMIETIFDGAPGRGANVRIGLMTFNHEQQVVAHIGQYTTKARLLTELSNLRFVGGGSFLGKGLEFAAKTVFPNSGNGRPSRLADKRVAKVAIVFTDGKSFDDVVAPSAALRKLGVTIFVAGTAGSGTVNTGAINEVASNPDALHTAFLSAFDYKESLLITNTLVRAVCSATATTTATQRTVTDKVVPVVDPAVPGTYTISYTAKNADGIVSTPVLRTVLVADREVPSIVIPAGDAVVTVEAMIGTLPETSPWGVAVEDNCINELPILNFVVESMQPTLGEDTEVLWCGRGFARSLQYAAEATASQSLKPLTRACGRYVVTYKATDATGNKNSASRTIVVSDTSGPITMTGSKAKAEQDAALTAAAAAANGGTAVDIAATASASSDAAKHVPCQPLESFAGAFALTYAHGLTASYTIDALGKVKAADAYFAGHSAVMTCEVSGKYAGWYKIEGLHRPGRTFEYLRIGGDASSAASSESSSSSSSDVPVVLDVRHFARDCKNVDPATSASGFCCGASGTSSCPPLASLVGVHAHFNSVGENEEYTITPQGFATAVGVRFVDLQPTKLMCTLKGEGKGSYRVHWQTSAWSGAEYLSIDRSTTTATAGTTGGGVFTVKQATPVKHHAIVLEGLSCDDVWTDCKGCTSTGGFCGTPSGAVGEVGGRMAVVVCGEAKCTVTASR